MIKRAGKMSDHDARSVHRLRIAGKRSRYALEFFQSLYRDKGTRTYLKMLSFMQDELGRHNDLAVADHLLQELAQRHPAATPAINFARGYLQALQGQQPTDLDGMRRMLHELKLPH
jgi:CHAD domain-containing protein